MPTADVWTESFPIRSYHVTPHGTASVLALCDLFQDAAGHHADALGVSMQDLLDDGKAWVLAHLRLQIDRLPRWEETAVIETWPSGLERLYATREFVLRTADGAPLAVGTSGWVVIDTARRRPVRPPRALGSLETPDRPAPLPHDTSDLPAPERTDHKRTFGVRYHDLDLNRHVNNVRYAEWALETLPPAWHDAHRCTHLALQFRAETMVGDTVRAVAQVETPSGVDAHVRHALHADDRTLAHATTGWTRR
mgnify:FL=1